MWATIAYDRIGPAVGDRRPIEPRADGVEIAQETSLGGWGEVEGTLYLLS